MDYEALRQAILEEYCTAFAESPALVHAGVIAEKLGEDPGEVSEQIEILAADGYLETSGRPGPTLSAWPTAQGKKRAKEGYVPGQALVQINIGAVIDTVTGGAVQAVAGTSGSATVSQIVNNPTALDATVEALCGAVISEVTGDLSAEDLRVYAAAVDRLRDELSSDRPKRSQNAIRRALATLAFAADVGGTMSLMAAVAPYVHTLTLICAQLVEQSP